MMYLSYVKCFQFITKIYKQYFMHCPFCNKEETKVTDSRLVSDGREIRRRRECIYCQERFTTYEVAELGMPMIVKRDGRRVPFCEQNIRIGLSKALEKRPVSVEQIEEVIGCVKHNLQVSGIREIQSSLIGEWIMKELKMIDKVAYVRFASVYCCFQDISDFNVEIDKIK